VTHRISVATAVSCRCAFCKRGVPHPAHMHGGLAEWADLGSRLLVAESLRSEDRVPVQACTLCGHLRVAV
jgi:hypothetical protein